MRWNSQLSIAGALGAVVIGGIAMTVLSGTREAVASTQVTTAIQKIVDGENHHGGRFRDHGPVHRRGTEGTAVGEQLGIEVDTFRDAVRAVIAARQEAGVEKPEDMTAEEREAHRAEFIADVAAELGLVASELEAAFDAVFEARQQQGVVDGKLTEAEAAEMRAAYASDTLHERQIEGLGDKLEQLLEAGIIDDTQYAALQAELDQSDMEGFGELMREYRGDSGIHLDRPRSRDGRGGPGFGSRHGGDAPVDEGVAL
jgi:hypothetical protein